MDGVAEKAIRDVASMSTHHNLTSAIFCPGQDEAAKKVSEKGEGVQEVVMYVETPKDLYEFIEDAGSNIRLEDVDVTKVL